MKNMKRILSWGLAGSVCAIVGCSTPLPETMTQSERDKQTYVDNKGAMTQRSDVSFRIAVCVDQKDYERHPKVGEAIEAQLAEVVSKFKMFEFVERSRINALAAERLFQGQDAEKSSLLKAADYLLSVKLNDSSEKVDVQFDINGKPTNESNIFNHTEKRWKINLKPDFRLYEVDSGKVVLMKSYVGEARLPGATFQDAKNNSESAVTRAMQKYTTEFSRLLTSRYAPKSRVLQTRGDGRVAQISIGSDHGIAPEMKVEFYSYVDNSDIVAGGERTENTVGYGRVLEGISPKTAWVEVLNSSDVQVLRGHYARVLEVKEKEDSFWSQFTKNSQNTEQEDWGTASSISTRQPRGHWRREYRFDNPTAPATAVPTSATPVAPVSVVSTSAPQLANNPQMNPTGRFATKDSQTVTYTAQGKGKTKALAELAALRQALWQALGLYVGKEIRNQSKKEVVDRLEKLTEVPSEKVILEERLDNTSGLLVIKLKALIKKTVVASIFGDMFPAEFSTANK